MSVRIQVNLASEPFQPARRVVVGTVAASVLLLGLLGLLISLSLMEKGQAADVRAAISRSEAELQRLSAEQSRLEAVLRKPENAEVLERNQFLNQLLFMKGISWTRLFDDLEQVMPHNVRLISIRPQVNGRNEISLDMTVGAESSEPVIRMLTRLESSPQFGATQIHQWMPPTQSEPLLRYRVSVNYAQKL